jgi:tRNA (cmo5U34)-methyltransferase
MNRELNQKSTISQIRERFDKDVERFSKLEIGQQAAIDSPLSLELVAQTAATHLQAHGQLLDLGCGAGNFTLSVLSRVSPLDCVLVDFSLPMLERARERVGAATTGKVEIMQADMRNAAFCENRFDTILAGAVLHHLREDSDWREMFQRLWQWLRPGGFLFVADLAVFDDQAVQKLMWQRYGNYLESLGGAEYRQKVFDYIDQEDSPRSLHYQMELLRKTGFHNYDILHRHSVFATYYARKPEG